MPVTEVPGPGPGKYYQEAGPSGPAYTIQTRPAEKEGAGQGPGPGERQNVEFMNTGTGGNGQLRSESALGLDSGNV